MELYGVYNVNKSRSTYNTNRPLLVLGYSIAN